MMKRLKSQNLATEKGGPKKSESIDDTDDEDNGGVENAVTNGTTKVYIVELFVTFPVNVFTSNVLV